MSQWSTQKARTPPSFCERITRAAKGPRPACVCGERERERERESALKTHTQRERGRESARAHARERERERERERGCESKNHVQVCVYVTSRALLILKALMPMSSFGSILLCCVVRIGACGLSDRNLLVTNSRPTIRIV